MNDNAELMEKFLRIGRLLHQNHRQGQKLCSDSCRGQGRVLCLLRNHPGLTQKEMCSLLQIRSQSLGELLGKLERGGCILREPSPEDRRVMLIRLTPKGLEAAGCAEENRVEAAGRFDCLTDREKRILSGYLERLVTEFEAAEAGPDREQG